MKPLKIITTSVMIAITTEITYADINSQLANLQTQINQLQTQISPENNINSAILGINPTLSWQMMENMSGVDKEMYLLTSRRDGWNIPLTIGGYAESDVIYQHTNSIGSNNTAEFNAIPLSNGATFTTTTGKSATQLFISHTNLATTAAINSWITAYIQTGIKNLNEAGASNNLQIQDAYIVAGNLTKSPIYAVIGQKEIDFGNFSSVNMYNSPITRDFFEGIGNTATLGINAYGLNATASAMNGGSSTNIYTTTNNSINNYALNLNYGATSHNINWNIGAGYLHGSRFLTTNNQTNGAWDANAKLSTTNFDLLAEYVATLSKSYGATASTPALTTIGQAVNAWDLGTDYNFPLRAINSTVSLDYSQMSLANGAANLLKQIVIGYRIEPVNNVWTGIEYSYNINGLNASTGSVYGSAYSSNTIVLDLTAAF